MSSQKHLSNKDHLKIEESSRQHSQWSLGLTSLYLKFVHSRTQLMFMLMGLAVIVVCVPMFLSFHRHVELRRAQNLNYNWPNYTDFLPSIGYFLILTCFRKISEYFLVPMYMNKLEPKYKGELRVEKAQKATKAVFKFFYFTLSTIMGYYVLKDEEYLPRSLFGSGDIHKIYKGFPFVYKCQYFDMYYTVQFGFHLESLFSHTLSKPRSDYMEMMLHHIVTLLLIFLSYMSNYSTAGAIILFLHDWSDILVSIVKAIADIKVPSWLLGGVFILLMVSWAYTRLYVLPFEVIKVCCFSSFHAPNMTLNSMILMTCMLLILLVLHFYWFVIFCQVLYHFIVKKKKQDMISNAEPQVEDKVSENHQKKDK